MGHDGIKTALAASKGEKVEANVDTGANLITKENMNSPRSEELLNPKVKVLIDPLLIFSCHRKAETSLYPGEIKKLGNFMILHVFSGSLTRPLRDILERVLQGPH
jgi:hypothetical protein